MKCFWCSTDCFEKIGYGLMCVFIGVVLLLLVGGVWNTGKQALDKHIENAVVKEANGWQRDVIEGIANEVVAHHEIQMKFARRLEALEKRGRRR